MASRHPCRSNTTHHSPTCCTTEILFSSPLSKNSVTRRVSSRMNSYTTKERCRLRLTGYAFAGLSVWKKQTRWRPACRMSDGRDIGNRTNDQVKHAKIEASISIGSNDDNRFFDVSSNPSRLVFVSRSGTMSQSTDLCAGPSFGIPSQLVWQSNPAPVQKSTFEGRRIEETMLEVGHLLSDMDKNFWSRPFLKQRA